MGEGNLRWKYNAGAAIQSEIITDSNGVIYFGTKTSKVVALNSDGSFKWAFSGSFNYIAGLALSNEGSIVYAVDGGKDVYAIYTADGTQKWKRGYWDFGENYSEPGICGIVVDVNDNIYVGSWCCCQGMYSIDYAGNFRWGLGDAECHSGHAIGKSDTVIYYQDVDYGLREVQLSDGTINWVHSGFGVGSYGTGISIASDGTIFYGASGYFYAINPDGSEKWNFSIGGSAETNNAIGSDGNIWFVDINGVNSKVFVVTPAGVEVWHYDMLNWIGPGLAGLNLALDSNDIVYLGSYDNKLYTINPDGSLRWTYTAGGDILSGIGFSPNEDTVYFGCDDGYLYAIEKIPSAPTCGIVAIGDTVMLCPISNRHGNMVALKSGNAAVSDKSLIAPLNNQAALKLDFRNCKTKQGDKVICASIGRAINNVLGLR